jgi:hypothetical protein
MSFNASLTLKFVDSLNLLGGALEGISRCWGLRSPGVFRTSAYIHMYANMLCLVLSFGAFTIFCEPRRFTFSGSWTICWLILQRCSNEQNPESHTP